MNYKKHINEIPDFPKKGINFKDISPLIRNGELFRDLINTMALSVNEFQPDIIAGIESRGFVIGSALSLNMGIGFIPLRKKGKLPGEVYGINYELEYGTDRLEISKDADIKDSNVLIIDDLLATGGTASAATQLIEIAGGSVAGYGFVVELPSLKGRSKLNKKTTVKSLIIYD